MIDYLFIGAHPDDCEIFAGGSILHLKQLGASVGILDLTRGERGSFGSMELRKQELDAATQLMNLDYRKTLDLEDAGVSNTRESREKIIAVLQELKPEILVSFPGKCRHPDHENTHLLVRQSMFLSGLGKKGSNTKSGIHRASALIEFIEFYPDLSPSFVIDITPYYQKKKELVKCYSSQVLLDEKKKIDPKHTTLIKSPAFWNNFEGKARWFGSLVGVEFGEAYHYPFPLKLSNPLLHLQKSYK